MPSKLACGVAYSYSLNKSNFQINELRKQILTETKIPKIIPKKVAKVPIKSPTKKNIFLIE